MYIEMIDEQINAYDTRIAGNKYIFQHDNVAVYSVKVFSKTILCKRKSLCFRVANQVSGFMYVTYTC